MRGTVTVRGCEAEQVANTFEACTTVLVVRYRSREIRGRKSRGGREEWSRSGDSWAKERE
jgi:hypothetical protein